MCQKATFTAFRGGMDSGTALGYPVISKIPFVPSTSLIFFVLVDGRYLVAGSLTQSFGGRSCNGRWQERVRSKLLNHASADHDEVGDNPYDGRREQVAERADEAEP